MASKCSEGSTYHQGDVLHKAYRKLINDISERLGAEDVKCIAHMYDLPASLRRSDAHALDVLDNLERRGTFTYSDVSTLEDLLRNANRNDLVFHVDQYRRCADLVPCGMRHASMPTLELEWDQQSCARSGHQRRTVSNPALMHESIRDFRLCPTCMHCGSQTLPTSSTFKDPSSSVNPRFSSSDFQTSSPILYESYSEEQQLPGFMSEYGGGSIPSSSFNLAFPSQEPQQHISLTVGTTQDLSDPNVVDSNTRMQLPVLEPAYHNRSALHRAPLYPPPSNVWQRAQDKTAYSTAGPDSRWQEPLQKPFHQRKLIMEGEGNNKCQCSHQRMQRPSQEYGQEDSGVCMSTSLLPSDPAEQELVCIPDAMHMHAQLPSSSSSTPQHPQAASLKPFVHGHQLEQESTSEGTLTPSKASLHSHRGSTETLPTRDSEELPDPQPIRPTRPPDMKLPTRDSEELPDPQPIRPTRPPDMKLPTRDSEELPDPQPIRPTRPPDMKQLDLWTSWPSEPQIGRATSKLFRSKSLPLSWQLKCDDLNDRIYKRKLRHKCITCPNKLELDVGCGRANPKLSLRLYPYGLESDMGRNATVEVEIVVPRKCKCLPLSATVRLHVSAWNTGKGEALNSCKTEKFMSLRVFHIPAFITHEDLKHSNSKWIEVQASAELRAVTYPDQSEY